MNIRPTQVTIAALMLAVSLPAVAAIDQSTGKLAYINVEQASDGSLSYECVGACNAKGDLDFSGIAGAVKVTFTVSSVGLDVSFCKPPGQTVLLARKVDIADGTCPTAPSTLPTFNSQNSPHNKPDQVQIIDNNNDHTTWVYGLVVCQKKADGTTSTFTYDPQIINH